MSSEPALVVSSLDKVYRLYAKPSHRLKQMLFGGRRDYFTQLRALSGVEFTIGKGESVAVLGVNGSGKSTLLQILSGNLQPTRGSVSVNGRVCALLELGSGFNPEFTGRENVYYGASLLGMSEDETNERFGSIAAFADIGEFMDRPVRCYSSGMYVRLAFALAAQMEPDVLLVDEVLAVGDIFFQQKCLLHMQQTLKDTTKVIVTHSLNTAANMSRRVLILHGGRLVFDGPPLEGIEEYLRRQRGAASDGTRVPPPGQEQLTEACTAAQRDHMTDIAPDKLSGALNARITAFSVEVDGKPYGGFVRPGAGVRLTAVVKTDREIEHPIVGYALADRFGIVLFGQNTVTAGLPLEPLVPGVTRLELAFTWPEIVHGEYFMTLGIGNGHDAMQHVIECWAHNIFHFSAITPGRDVHGLFNGSLHHVRMAILSAGSE